MVLVARAIAACHYTQHSNMTTTQVAHNSFTTDLTPSSGLTGTVRTAFGPSNTGVKIQDGGANPPSRQSFQEFYNKKAMQLQLAQGQHDLSTLSEVNVSNAVPLPSTSAGLE